MHKMDLQGGGGRKPKPQGALDSDKNHRFCLRMSESCMVFYLKEYENRLVFPRKARDVCCTAPRKGLLRKLKLIFISHCTHIQTCHKPYIQITQTHRTCATNTAPPQTRLDHPISTSPRHNTQSPPAHINPNPPASPPGPTHVIILGRSPSSLSL